MAAAGEDRPGGGPGHAGQHQTGERASVHVRPDQRPPAAGAGDAGEERPPDEHLQPAEATAPPPSTRRLEG